MQPKLLMLGFATSLRCAACVPVRRIKATAVIEAAARLREKFRLMRILNLLAQMISNPMRFSRGFINHNACACRLGLDKSTQNRQNPHSRLLFASKIRALYPELRL